MFKHKAFLTKAFEHCILSVRRCNICFILSSQEKKLYTALGAESSAVMNSQLLQFCRDPHEPGLLNQLPG